MGYQKTPSLSSTSSKKTNTMGYQKTPSLSSNNYKKNIGVGGSAMGYQKKPTLSSNNYKKNVGVGGSGSFGGSSDLLVVYLLMLSPAFGRLIVGRSFGSSLIDAKQLNDHLLNDNLVAYGYVRYLMVKYGYGTNHNEM
ncbi:hypothetical protein Tco_1505779 [Tanacetum coccineum]